jgi:hypothetical protein
MAPLAAMAAIGLAIWFGWPIAVQGAAILLSLEVF